MGHGRASTAVVVLASGAAWPVATGIESRALRQVLDDARYQERDVTVTQRPPTQAFLLDLEELPSAAEMREEVLAGLPESVRRVAEDAWGFQRTRVSVDPVFGASLVGEGVSGEPDGRAPAVALYHQTGLEDDVEIVSGVLPDNAASADVLEVMVEASVAEAVGLRVGGEYRMIPGALGVEPQERPGEGLPVRLVGTFRALDPDAAVWEPVPELLRTTVVQRFGAERSRVVRVDLVTGEGGFDLLFERGLNRWLLPESVGRLRVDAQRVDRAWAETRRCSCRRQLMPTRCGASLPPIR